MRQRRMIPIEEATKAWRTEPEYRAAYDALEGEFALASAMVAARAAAGMTRQQVAEAMGTTQAVVARLESGRVMPSSRTLERFARATGTRLRVSFEREPPPVQRRDRSQRPAFSVEAKPE